MLYTKNYCNVMCHLHPDKARGKRRLIFESILQMRKVRLGFYRWTMAESGHMKALQERGGAPNAWQDHIPGHLGVSGRGKTGLPPMAFQGCCTGWERAAGSWASSHHGMLCPLGSRELG